MADARKIAEGMRRCDAQRALLCAQMWPGSDPANPRLVPGISCSPSYSPSVQRALVEKGLAEREMGVGAIRFAWFYLTPLGLAVRDELERMK